MIDLDPVIGAELLAFANLTFLASGSDAVDAVVAESLSTSW